MRTESPQAKRQSTKRRTQRTFGTAPALDAEALASLLASNPVLLEKALESVLLAITPDFISEAQISKRTENRMKIRR